MSEAMYITAKMYNDEHFLNKSEFRIMRNRLHRQRVFRRQILMLTVFFTLLIILFSFTHFTFHADAQSEDFQPEFKYYTTITVHANDDLWSIASDNYPSGHYKSLNSYMDEICTINGILNQNDIKAGESLIIPYFSTQFK